MIARSKRAQGELKKNPTMYVDEGQRQRMSAAGGLVANWDYRVVPKPSKEEGSRKITKKAGARKGTRITPPGANPKATTREAGISMSQGKETFANRGHGRGTAAAPVLPDGSVRV